MFAVARCQSEIKLAREMEFIWHGSKSIGSDYPMWTHLMDNHYCTPSGFNWEHGVTQDLPDGDGPPPMIVDPPSPYTEANDLQRATDFVTMARTRATVYKTNNILIPFGCDFTFQNANMMFKNMDLLIDAINRYSTQLNAVARYTTLDDYAAAVKASTSNWTVRTDDFYPYADNSRSYWTGYFSSRPTLKSMSRTSHNVLRGTDFAHTFARAAFPVDRAAQMNQVFMLRGAEAVVQHHDGVTGTFRELVGEDYIKYLLGGMDLANEILADNLGRLVSNGAVNQLSADANTLVAGLNAGRRAGPPMASPQPCARGMAANVFPLAPGGRARPNRRFWFLLGGGGGWVLPRTGRPLGARGGVQHAQLHAHGVPAFRHSAHRH